MHLEFFFNNTLLPIKKKKIILYIVVIPKWYISTKLFRYCFTLSFALYIYILYVCRYAYISVCT